MHFDSCHTVPTHSLIPYNSQVTSSAEAVQEAGAGGRRLDGRMLGGRRLAGDGRVVEVHVLTVHVLAKDQDVIPAVALWSFE